MGGQVFLVGCGGTGEAAATVWWGIVDGAPLQTWGIAVLSPRLSSRSPLGTHGLRGDARGRRGVGICREIVRYCEALAPLQGALIGVVGYLGHRGAQPQAVLLVPDGDAGVRWGGGNGLGVGGSGGPTARGHTSLGQRPRWAD